MAVLDTTGLWTEGDDYRVISALGLPFGQYTLSCIAGCMNDLQAMSTAAQQDVLDLLDDYEAADQLETDQHATDSVGKVLVKADVLEWEVVQGGGPSAGKSKARYELAQIFSFCTCLGGSLSGYGGATPLIRS